MVKWKDEEIEHPGRDQKYDTILMETDPDRNEINYSRNYRIFRIETAIPDVVSLYGITDDIELNDNDPQYLYRYIRFSHDQYNWSLWYEFTPGRGDDFSSIAPYAFNPDKYIYYEIQYKYDDGTYDQLKTPVRVNQIKVTVELKEYQLPNHIKAPALFCTEERCPAIFVNRNVNFDPYDVGPSVHFYKEMSYSTNVMFGHEVVYFKTEYDKDSGDYIFKEWTLYNVTDRKCVKVLVPDNDFPDNRPEFEEFGVEFNQFEIHIDMQYFASFFGEGSRPNKRDFLYFPLINRMFQVQDAYFYRYIMMEPIYYRIQLQKYRPNADMSMSTSNKKFLDNIITSAEDLFEEPAQDQTEVATMEQQYPDDRKSQKFDEVRQALNEKLNIRQTRFYFNYAALIDYYYNVSDVPVSEEYAVKYNFGPKFDQDSSATYIAFFNLNRQTNNVHLLTSYDETSSSGIDIYLNYNQNNSQLDINFQFGVESKSVTVNQIKPVNWYAVVIEVSNEFQQYAIYLYDIVEDIQISNHAINNHNDFQLLKKQQGSITQQTFDLSDQSYIIPPSNSAIANLRIFNTMVKQEKHEFILSQLFIQDEDMLYLIDNCRPRLNAPFITRNK